MNKRILSALLVLLMLVSFAVSCGGGDGGASETTAAVGEDTASEVVTTTEEVLMPELDGLDYEGTEFIILIPDWSLYSDYYIAEEQNGDVINDAIFDRRLKTEEALNVTIVDMLVGDTSSPGINQIYPRIQKSVLSGAGEYDLAATHCITHLSNLTSEKLLIDWNTIENVDFDMPWWNSMMNETMSVNGQLYFAANDYILPDPNAVYFNKDILHDYELASPYDAVKDGTWTWDMFTEMSRKVSSDLNGDGEFGPEDLYGYSTLLTWTSISVMYACDQFMLEEDDGQMKLALNNEKMVSITEMYSDLVYGSQSSYVKMTMTDDEKKIFDNGRALLTIASINQAKDKRALEIDFGILPYPKYDEAQETYISNNWAGLLVVPIDVKDVAMTGAVSEYLGYISGETVVPVYYDVLLNTKLVRDEESSEMLDIIFSNSAYDIGMVYSNFNRLFYTLVYMIDEQKEFGSYYAAEESAVQARYDTAFEVYFE